MLRLFEGCGEVDRSPLLSRRRPGIKTLKVPLKFLIKIPQLFLFLESGKGRRAQGAQGVQEDQGGLCPNSPKGNSSFCVMYYTESGFIFF